MDAGRMIRMQSSCRNEKMVSISILLNAWTRHSKACRCGLCGVDILAATREPCQFSFVIGQSCISSSFCSSVLGLSNRPGTVLLQNPFPSFRGDERYENWPRQQEKKKLQPGCYFDRHFPSIWKAFPQIHIQDHNCRDCHRQHSLLS